MLKVADIKAILEQIKDDEDIVIRMRPADNDMDVGTLSINRVKYVEIVYHVPRFTPKEIRDKDRKK